MVLIKQLLTTDSGLMSAAGIVFMLGMGALYVRYFIKHMQEDERREKEAGR